MLIWILLIRMFSLTVSYVPSQNLGKRKDTWYFIESKPIYKRACVLRGLLLLFLQDIYSKSFFIIPSFWQQNWFHDGLILLLEIRGSSFQWAVGSRNKFILRRNECFWFWMNPRWGSECGGKEAASVELFPDGKDIFLRWILFILWRFGRSPL